MKRKKRRESLSVGISIQFDILLRRCREEQRTWLLFVAVDKKRQCVCADSIKPTEAFFFCVAVMDLSLLIEKNSPKILFFIPFRENLCQPF